MPRLSVVVPFYNVGEYIGDCLDSIARQTYADFEVMRMNEMPTIEMHLVPSQAPPSGFGEHAVPPVAPAVANAVFAATGKRLRRLPITPAKLNT